MIFDLFTKSELPCLKSDAPFNLHQLDLCNSVKMKFQLIAAIVGFGIGCRAIPTLSTHALHEKRSSMPRLWERGSRVDGHAILPVRIGLTQNNLDNGYDYLMDV